MRAPRLRTVRQFAESEIVIPTGPFAGLRYSCRRQPFTRLWFDAVDSARWRRVATTGPAQSGKTLMGFVIPTLYHLFEIGETVIVGLPSMDMAGDKWTNDLLPAIQATRYRDLLPRAGAGSRGGRSNLLAVQFSNGATLRFMSGGGDDKSRAAYTTRVLVTTETDGLDLVSEGSREADKVSQLEARTQAYGDRARIYHECTVSTERGRIWQEYTGGTETRIAIRCPHCRRYVTPEREHLIGWQDADDEIQAGERAAFGCPNQDCGTMWSEEDRTVANHDCIAVHRGQEVTPDGTIVGQPAKTDTFGFRWTAVNNLLVRTPVIGKREWKAARAADEDNADKGMLQFWWTRPFKPSQTSLSAMDPQAVTRRTLDEPRGRVPSGAGRITIGIDVGKYLCHWVAVAWLPNATPHVIEYGRKEVATNDLGEERAILSALRSFRDEDAKGWPADDGTRKPSLVCVDAGNWQDIILTFCAESPGYQACKGFGIRQIGGGRQIGQRNESGWTVVGASPEIGVELISHPAYPARMLDVKADAAKTWAHARLQTPMGQPGALTLHLGNEHLGFAKHLLAEKKVEEFVAGKGLVTRWEQVNRNNHFLDALCLALTAGRALGERLVGEPTAPTTPPPSEAGRVSASEWMSRGRERW